MKIDSHQHFWKYDPLRHQWITDSMQRIREDFLPVDLAPVLSGNGFDGCIVVQVDQNEEETNFLLQLANENGFIKGVVGWVDLSNENIEERLTYFSQFKILKGFRHIVQAEPKDDFLLSKNFCRGITLLAKYHFTYDILIYEKHLPYVYEFVKKFPQQKFVIDHIAKPDIKHRSIATWKTHMSAIAWFENVYCKLSGMVTEADWQQHTPEDFKPYIDHVLDVFGSSRVMFGSDWPVCLVTSSYSEVCEIVQQNTLHLTKEEKEKLWGLNAQHFYGI